MKCPSCEKDVIERQGKYGAFLCCPSGQHGTFSIQKGVMYFTGEIGNLLKRNRVEECYERLAHISSGAQFQPTLTQLMNAQMASFGWNSGGEVEQLADFALGDPETMWDDEERENGDHWWNLRPY